MTLQDATNDNPEGTLSLNISLTLYKQLISAQAFKTAMISKGVDNWRGYDDAFEYYQELLEDLLTQNID